MNNPAHTAYYDAIKADDAYSAELRRVYGKRAQEMRYHTREHTDPALIAAGKRKRAADEKFRVEYRRPRLTNPRGGRFDRCVADVSRSHSALNPYAVCASRLKQKRRRVRRANPRSRFHVAVWHGEGGSIGRVIDRHSGRVKGEYSTRRDGASWRSLADAQAAALNKGGGVPAVRRRKRNVTRRGSRGQLFSLIARKANQAPMFYTGDKFARHGKPVLFQNLKTAKAVAAFMHRQYPSLRGYTIWAREV